MKYIVYLTTNIINGKIYVGVHRTENPDIFDGYLGDGVMTNMPKTYKCCKTAFHCAVTKYGPSNFKRKTLRVFDTMQDALDLEAWIVTRDFIARTDVYNIALGGGIPPRLNKHIYQYNLKGYLIKEWDSIKAITDYYKVNKDRIRMCINDKRSFEASYWSEIKYIQLDTKEYRPSARGSIKQYTTDGIFLKSFKNTTEAAKALDIDRNKITNAIYGKYAIDGYWFLKENETIESYLDGSIKKEKPIYCYNNNGEFYKSYNSFKDIKKEFKFNKPNLKRAIKNNELLYDYYWSHFKYDNILIENPEIDIKKPKKIYQYTLEGDFVKEWDSINECKKNFLQFYKYYQVKEYTVINLNLLLISQRYSPTLLVITDNNNAIQAMASFLRWKDLQANMLLLN